jgi:dUTPase
MSEPTLALQTALYSALDAALSCSVYDSVPQGAAMPYVTLEFQDVEDADFLGEKRDFRAIYLAVWSSYRGQKEVLELMQTIYNTLHEQSLTLSTGRIAQMRVVSRRTNREPDGVTYMGQVRVNILTEH